MERILKNACSCMLDGENISGGGIWFTDRFIEPSVKCNRNHRGKITVCMSKVVIVKYLMSRGLYFQKENLI